MCHTEKQYLHCAAPMALYFLWDRLITRKCCISRSSVRCSRVTLKCDQSHLCSGGVAVIRDAEKNLNAPVLVTEPLMSEDFRNYCYDKSLNMA